MRSVDTNIALRILLQDHPEQAKIAESILTEPTLLLSTVVLEMVWVLTGKGWSRGEIARALKGLLDLEQVHFPDRAAITWVVERFLYGGDFADMLHVALSGDAKSFVTFDQKLGRYCEGGPVPIETLPGD